MGDVPSLVAQNRQHFKTQACMPTEPLWLQQVHGIVVARPDLAKVAAATAVVADAAYSCAREKVCVVMTADCLPLLVCDKAGREVAAIHAGWRGLAAGVIEQTIMHFKAKPADIMVWLGPAIGPQSFEVGAEVRAAFVSRHPATAAAFKVQANGKYLADIYLLARLRLAVQGITAIYGGNYCTYQQAEHFFSYRRDGQTGRMASAIWLD
ncbi:laccase domain protein [Alishewanella longhuensis]|uniref:Purine nucleoside phosphorylase n=1 Tax=Alishewanella longhuensis TaxID=1091037 RepID=A0ABQ3L015_9ALTE|nr:laccase domain protein [Alishewanella longhuensis]